MPAQAVRDAVSRDRLRSIIERLPDGIVVVDRQGIIRFANPAAERLFGRPAAELVGSPFGFPVFAGETTEIDIVQRGGTGVVFAELRVVDTEWEEEHVELVSLRDVTDRKFAEERTRQLSREREARLEAEAANQAKSEFLAIMSHELRTPLNAVLGYSEILELGLSGPLTDKMREQIGRIRMSGRHLLGLVNEILDLAKVESGKLTVQSSRASGLDVVNAAIALTHPQAAAHGLDLVRDEVGDESLTFVGDEERVRQILVNLLSNAVKFTPPGGRITIHGAAVATPDVDARLVPRRKYVVFRVTDTGMGIEQDKLAAIFDPFVQADTGPTREREGSGLGLTISRRLARLMGGDLTVRSTPGSGSTFSLWMPGDEDEADVTRRTARASARDEAEAELEGVCEAGTALLERMPETVDSIVERIRRDPNLGMAAGLKRFQIADHLATLLADTAVAFLVTGSVGAQMSPLLADATEIQRLIAERHGQQRAALGWTESALRREFMIIREEAGRVVRQAFDPAGRRSRETCDDAAALLDRFVDQAEYVAARSLIAAQQA